MPGDQRSAMQRLFEAQARPASPGTTAAEIQALLEQAAMAEQQTAQAPMQNAVADNWWDPRPEILQAGQEMRQRNTPPGMSGPPAPLLGREVGAHTAESLAATNAPTPPPAAGSRPGVTGSGVTTNTNPETLLEPMMQGSAVQAPQEATRFQSGIDPATGDVVFQAPGVQGGIRAPLNMSEDEAGAFFMSMGNGWTGTDSFGPNPSVSPARAAEMLNDYLRLRAGAARQPGQPTGPLTTTQIDFEQSTGGPVDPANAARLAAADEAVRRAQSGADRTALGEVAARAGAFGGRADMLRQQADQAAQQEQQFQTELRDRMGQFESAIREVSNRRIDPNRYFGPGAGGRIGAALAVALGEIGAGLTGRPNAALGIIDAAINRDLQAQQSDSENARAAANMRGTAIQQMRSIIGDERGAQAAVRAAHYQAFLSQIDQQLTTASGANLQALQVLRAAVLEQIAAQQAVAADQASMSVRQRVTTQARSRGGSTAIDAAGAAATQRIARQQPQTAPQTAAQPQAATPAQAQPETPPTAMQRVLDGNLFQAEGEIEIAPGVRIPGIGAAPVSTPSAQMAVQAARTRLQRNPNDRGARETVQAAERETRSDARRFERHVRRAMPRIQPWDPEDTNRVLTRVTRWAAGGTESGAPLPNVLPPGYRWLTPEDGATNGPDLYRTRIRMGAEAERELLVNTRMLNILNDALPTILGARREFQGEATSVERKVQLAQQMARNFRGVLQQSRSGATLTEQEIAMYEAMLPDPDTITAANVLGLWDRVEGAWTTFSEMYGTQARSVLRNFGITTDSTAGNARQRQRAVAQARDAETEAAFQQGDEGVVNLFRQIRTRNAENRSREGN